MHEMSIVKRFMNIAIHKAQLNHLSQIHAIVLQVGEMNDLDSFYLQKYFMIASQGTILQNAELIIETVPMKVICQDCHTLYNPMYTPKRLCPVCQSGNCHILAGRDIFVKEIQVEKTPF